MNSTISVGDMLCEFKEKLGDNVEPEVLTLTERNGFVAQSTKFKKRLAVADTKSYKVIRRGDIAFNPYLLWAGAVAHNTDWEAGLISPLYPTFRVREGYDSTFVSRLLLTGNMIDRYDTIAFGSVPRKRRSSVENFLALEIPKPPPLFEQRRISNILDKADELRNKRRVALAELDSLTQSIFHSIFEHPTANAERWPTVALESVASQITDGEHQTPIRQSSGIKLLSARNVRNGRLDVGNVDYIDLSEYERISRRCRPQRDDVLISCSGSIGRVAVVDTDENFSLVRSVALVRPYPEKLLSKFLEQQLLTPKLQRKMKQSANASSQANLFQGPIRKLPVVLPPLELQGDFVDKATAVERLKDQHRAQMVALDDLFASLQHRAFMGEL